MRAPEVRRGLWTPSWLQSDESGYRVGGTEQLQEAALGMWWKTPCTGAPIRLVGMHPEEEVVEFALPAPPRMEIEVEGTRELVEPRLTNLVIMPHEKTFTLTWAGVRRSLPRKFVPGIHGYIPLKMYVDGGLPIEYETPPTVYQQMKEAERRGRARPAAPSRPGEKTYVELFPGLLADEGAVRERESVTPERVRLLGEMDVPTGRVLLRETDWVLEGASFAFEWTRHYSSSRSWRAGVLGPGWSHPLEEALWVEEGALWYRTRDGREVQVAHLPSGELGLGEGVHHPLEHVTVRRIAGDTYEVLHQGGARVWLTHMPRTVQVGPVQARVTRLMSPEGVVAEVGYDTHGQLARLTLPSRRELRFEHDLRGRLIAIYAPTVDGTQHAVAARYEHDGAGQLIAARDGAGNTTKYKYAARLLSQRITPGGEVFRYQYDGDTAHARVVSSERVEGAVTRELLFNADNRTAVPIDALGKARAVKVDEAHRVTLTRDSHGLESTFEYDEATGLCIAAVDRLGGRTEYLYDSEGHLAEETHPDGSRTVLDHDSQGHLTARTDTEGAAERWGWDAHGRIHARTDASGASTVFDYDDAGRLSALVTPGEVRVMLGYDEAGQLRYLRSPLGERRITSDALGRPREIADEDGNVTGLRFDPAGRIRAIDHGSETRFGVERGPLGDVVRYGDGARDVTLERDKAGRIGAVRCRDEEVVEIHRDLDGRVTLVQNAALELHELRYDARGNLQEESAPDGAITRYTYDAEQRLVRIARPGFDVSGYERDARGRVVLARHGDDEHALEERFERSPGGRVSAALTSSCEVRFERDGMGRVTRERMTRGELESEVRSQYDAHGFRTRVVSSHGLDVRIDRDASGGAIELRMLDSESAWTIGFTLDGRGRERERRLPGGLVLRTDRDGLGRVVRRRILWEGRVLDEASFGYAGVGRLVGTSDAREGQTALVHDARGHLVALRRGMGQLVRPVDELGNLYRVPERDDHRYGTGGRLLDAYGTTYRYDEAGRRIEKETVDGSITRYRWEGPNRLAEVELPEGQRVRYERDALGRVVVRRLERGEEVTSWIWLDGQLVGTVQNGRRYAVLTDPLGVVREIVEESGALVWRGGVDSFGVGWRELERLRQPWRWPGHLEDEDTGLALSVLRAYDPEAAQYLSPCPLGIASGPSLYAYVRDPLSETSPLGLGLGLDLHIGGEIPPCSETLHVGLLLEALDRDDGAAGPRERFEATPLLPDPMDLTFGPWARCHPRRMR